MSEPLSSETRLTWLRKMATEQCPFLIDQSDLLALVECAEALRALNQYPGYIKNRGPAMLAWANAQGCLAKLEAL